MFSLLIRNQDSFETNTVFATSECRDTACHSIHPASKARRIQMKVFVTGAGGFIGGTIAAHLARAGHEVRGLVRRPEQFAALEALGIAPVQGDLDDRALLMQEARAAGAVINAASSDHRGAVETLLDALEGSGKTLLHTSGSSIVGDASGGEPTERIYHEGALPEPTPDKAPRVAID